MASASLLHASEPSVTFYGPSRPCISYPLTELTCVPTPKRQRHALLVSVCADQAALSSAPPRCARILYFN